MTYKQIEASREARLWIGQVIVPAAIGVTYLASRKDVRDYVKDKKEKIKEKFKKK